jgi:Na+/H+ antiporter NhaD/arsenite permease-like protein
MQSVWNSGFIQKLIINMNVNITNLLMIFIVSIVLSQFISNVPLVALYLPMLLEAGASSKEIIALAASSTIAGNLFILGAASTVIIVQNAEKRSNETITFLEFARVGIPLTILNAAVYYVYLSFF